ncbi:DNA-binding response regulator [Sporanaerobium hydrogeniformans]|uniref:DNA-binding response regulator n=1 Tax=Sporanaerobium hydrogeniformans TaxID=3072179 RepID=A0AC61D9D0_9FIRM|nr:response regulator [Sporanaerobium hydrogeniformans]PHV69969.1 DNA-binding response regulator [Sporanaerobium hydrogeniformans]
MLKVLIVEDEDMIRKGLIHTMDWTNMECTVVGEAGNGQEGLERIKELMPDIVFTDIIMPKMTGIEMLELAKGFVDFKSVILTSYSEFGYAQKAINLKVSDYLLKPIDEEELLKVVEKIRKEINEKRTYSELLEKTKDKSKMQLVDLDIYIQQKEASNPYVEKAITAIKENYSTKLSIEAVADTLGVSSSYLSRKFKEETAQTFLEMLHKYRLQKAIELLGQGSYRVYEVSDMTGFSEYKNFCAIFKKYTGMAPTEFAKNKSFIIQKAVK